MISKQIIKVAFILYLLSILGCCLAEQFESDHEATLFSFLQDKEMIRADEDLDVDYHRTHHHENKIKSRQVVYWLDNEQDLKKNKKLGKKISKQIKTKVSFLLYDDYETFYSDIKGLDNMFVNLYVILNVEQAKQKLIDVQNLVKNQQTINFQKIICYSEDWQNEQNQLSNDEKQIIQSNSQLITTEQDLQAYFQNESLVFQFINIIPFQFIPLYLDDYKDYLKLQRHYVKQDFSKYSLESIQKSIHEGIQVLQTLKGFNLYTNQTFDQLESSYKDSFSNITKLPDVQSKSKALLKMYTDQGNQFYGVLNSALNSLNENVLKPFKPMIGYFGVGFTHFDEMKEFRNGLGDYGNELKNYFDYKNKSFLLYRGTTISNQMRHFLTNTTNIGRYIVMAAFTSTSSNQTQAVSYLQRKPADQRLLLEITHSYKNDDEFQYRPRSISIISEYPEEKEYLFPLFSVFQVQKYYFDSTRQVNVLELTYIHSYDKLKEDTNKKSQFLMRKKIAHVIRNNNS
ncbi:hypothetical protein TTHERM_00355700 (macronuclear) [Tetrahymena thermophila SB210]|uniref:NAD(+)--protein-arginine ADP-ribosyltransferase n=1 Tax=Tetrahymena thermophila (strain SB210) TaxID=312017 RepID=Q22Y01_TETTS|nr:hypothetical protein TTHERM_00355700 [Tetrahymena thermophila SB210]EAR90223.2 hypothetical protein TTHERM_00355700 [Tetrahymena thermophila SB210]|eukprot:XP_001010468.2 hypothetical protein TTHERM_00355700 [Tetrahymena thermophila SB210]